MNPHSYEEMAWLRLQDIQREADNRRLLGRRPSVTMAALRRFVAWAVAAARLPDQPAESAQPASAECGQEVA
jgi:hypothetical protein